MIIKGWEICKNAYFLYFSYSIVIDKALYGIVWYGPPMVAVLTLLSIYICVDHGEEGKLMNIWACGYDDTMCSLCLHSYSSCDSLSKCKSMIGWSIGASIDDLNFVK